MTTKKVNKFNLGDIVYFLALDDNARWAVFGSIIRAVYKTPDGWEYTVKGRPVNYKRREENLYLDMAAAKKAADNLNKPQRKTAKPELPK